METKVPELSDSPVNYVSDGVIVSCSFDDNLSFRIANEDGKSSVNIEALTNQSIINY